MDYRIGFRQVNHEIEKQVEKVLWEKYLTIYPLMNKDNFITFNDFKEKHKPRKKLGASDKSRIDRQAETIRKKVVRE